jgi:hypothetical protein
MLYLCQKVKNMLEELSIKLNKTLPLYIPKSRRFSDKLHLAIWNCGDCKRHKNLYHTLQDTRITLRKNRRPILVIKKGDA